MSLLQLGLFYYKWLVEIIYLNLKPEKSYASTDIICGGSVLEILKREPAIIKYLIKLLAQSDNSPSKNKGKYLKTLKNVSLNFI